MGGGKRSGYVLADAAGFAYCGSGNRSSSGNAIRPCHWILPGGSDGLTLGILANGYLSRFCRCILFDSCYCYRAELQRLHTVVSYEKCIQNYTLLEKVQSPHKEAGNQYLQSKPDKNCSPKTCVLLV